MSCTRNIIGVNILKYWNMHGVMLCAKNYERLKQTKLQLCIEIEYYALIIYDNCNHNLKQKSKVINNSNKYINK